MYVTALSLYKDQRATDAITALQALAPADLESTEACLRARIHCLTGRCLSRLVTLALLKCVIHVCEKGFKTLKQGQTGAEVIFESVRAVHVETCLTESLTSTFTFYGFHIKQISYIILQKPVVWHLW